VASNFSGISVTSRKSSAPYGRPVNIVMLLTDGFGGFRGHSEIQPRFHASLDASSIAERVYALPQLIPHAIEAPIPESVVYDRKAAEGKFAFLRRVLGTRGAGPNPIW
jgi:hypothetical protein